MNKAEQAAINLLRHSLHRERATYPPHSRDAQFADVLAALDLIAKALSHA